MKLSRENRLYRCLGYKSSDFFNYCFVFLLQLHFFPVYMKCGYTPCLYSLDYQNKILSATMQRNEGGTA